LEFAAAPQEALRHEADARREVARYIDRYNRIRRHSACECKSPIDYGAILAARAADGPEAEAA
jgi:hypothetical protein